ncbi:hypothetical protein [Moraxella lacunata]
MGWYFMFIVVVNAHGCSLWINMSSLIRENFKKSSHLIWLIFIKFYHHK